MNFLGDLDTVVEKGFVNLVGAHGDTERQIGLYRARARDRDRDREIRKKMSIKTYMKIGKKIK